MNITTAPTAPQQLALAVSPSGGGTTALSAPDDKSNGDFQAFGDDGFTFFDFLDIVNPLQHIPFVSTLYREMTGDSIDPGSRIAGGTLFGGPIGAAISVANVALEYQTGKDMGEHMIALFEDDATEQPLLADAARGGAVDTAQDDVRSHIEVRQWAEREAAFHAAQAAAFQTAPRARQARAGASSPGLRPLSSSMGASLVALADVSPMGNAPSNGSLSASHRGSPGSASFPQAASPSNASSSSSPGALANGGGWFSDTMLTALSRYQEAQQVSDLVASQKLKTP